MSPEILRDRWRMIETDAVAFEGALTEVNSRACNQFRDAVRYVAVRMVGEAVGAREKEALERLEEETWEGLRDRVLDWAAGIEGGRAPA